MKQILEILQSTLRKRNRYSTSIWQPRLISGFIAVAFTGIVSLTPAYASAQSLDATETEEFTTAATDGEERTLSSSKLSAEMIDELLEDTAEETEYQITAKTPPTVSRGATRAIWLWEDSRITKTKQRNAFFEFATIQKINRIYVDGHALLAVKKKEKTPTAKQRAFARFTNIAASKGMAVELLYGDKSWTYEKNHKVAVAFAKQAKKYTAGLKKSDTRPAAMHFDVEPHTLREWRNKEKRQLLGKQYIVLLSKLKKNKGSLDFNIDYPMAFDTAKIRYDGQTRPLVQWIYAYIDSGTLMDYRDYAEANGDGIIPHAKLSVKYAREAGKTVTLGVETKCQSPEYVTFCTEGRAVLNREVRKTHDYYASNAGYQGIAVHDYTNWTKLGN